MNCQAESELPLAVLPASHVMSHVLLPDASGSMEEPFHAGSRLDAAFQACTEYVRRLQDDAPDSQVAIVSYSNDACRLLEWTCVSSLGDLTTHRNEWLACARDHGLERTNIAAALLEAAKMLDTRNGAAQVVLLTDGHHNIGDNPRPIAMRLKAQATIATVGIGDDPQEVQEHLLKQLASRGNDGAPLYRWIDDRGRLIAHFNSLAGRLTRS